MTTNRIEGFQGEFRYLSNFWESPLYFAGEMYSTSEHAYQAARFTDPSDKLAILDCSTPGRAKRLAREMINAGHAQTPDWYEGRGAALMSLIQQAKFSWNWELGEMLRDTGDAEIIESNTWHDNYWGACTCEECETLKKKNTLGKILMAIRSTL